jgi:hypothetical protein
LPQQSKTSDWVDVPAQQAQAQGTGTGDDGWVDVPQVPGQTPGAGRAGGGAGGAGATNAATPAVNRPGAVTRFARGLRGSMGMDPEGTLSSDISDLYTGFRQLATHPVDSAKTLLEGMNESQQQVIDQAYQEQHDPNFWTRARGYVRGAESVVPFVGPILSQAGDLAREGDYAGMVGTMVPLAVGRPMEEGVRAGRSGLAASVRATPKIAGLGGYAATSGTGHPFLGYIAGRELGEILRKPAGRLADMIEPEPRTTAFGTRIGGEWVPGDETPKTTLSQTMNDEPEVVRAPIRTTPFPGPLTPEQVPEGRLTDILKSGDPRAGQEFMRRGGKVVYTPEEGYAPPRERTVFSSKPGSTSQGTEAAPISPRAKNLKTGGQPRGPTRGPTAIDEATATPHEATRSRQTGVSAARLREEMRRHPAPGMEPEQERLIRTRTQPKPTANIRSLRRQIEKRGKGNAND